MATRPAYFDDLTSDRRDVERREVNVRVRPRSSLFDEWGRDDKPSIPMLRSRWASVTAAIVGLSVGVGAVALYAGGYVNAPKLNDTPVLEMRSSWTPNPEYDRALLAQTKSLVTAAPAVAPTTNTSTTPSEASTPNAGSETTPATGLASSPITDSASPSEELQTAPQTRGESVPPAIQNAPTREAPTGDNPY